MKTKTGKRILSLALSLVMALGLLPDAALTHARAADGVADAHFFAGADWSNGATTTLYANSGGSVVFSLSAWPSDTNYTTSDPVMYIYLYRDANTSYTLLDNGVPQYGATEPNNERGSLRNVTIPNVTPGIYSVRLVTGANVEYVHANAVTIAANGDAPTAPQITTVRLDDGQVGYRYVEQTLRVTGLSGTVTWSVTAGALPDGLTLDRTTGVIGGKPTKQGAFLFTVTAAAGGKTASRELSITVTKSDDVRDDWVATLDSSSDLCGAAADYTFTVKIKSLDNANTDYNTTVLPASSLVISLPNVGLTGAAVEITSPASGIAAEISAENHTVTLNFTAATEIYGPEGVRFTVKNATNPLVGSLSATVSSQVQEGGTVLNDKLDTPSALITMNPTTVSVPLRASTVASVTVADWNSYKDMKLWITVSAGEESESGWVNAETTSFTTLNIATDTPYAVELVAYDALGKAHTYFDSKQSPMVGTVKKTGDGGEALTELKGDGAANAITITPIPSSIDVLTGYTLVTKLGDQETASVSATLYQKVTSGGTATNERLIAHNGKYWLVTANAADLSVQASNLYALTSYSGDEPTLAVDGATITVTYPVLTSGAKVQGVVKNSSGEGALPNASVIATQTVNGVKSTFNTVTDKGGNFSFDSLYESRAVMLTAWKDGYAEAGATVDAASVTPGNTAQTEIALTAVGRVTVVIGDGQSVTNPRFTVNAGSTSKSYTFSGGTSFTLDLPAGVTANAATVTMYADDTVGSATATATLDANQNGAASLTVTRYGVLDWSGLGGTGYNVLIYGSDGLSRGDYPASSLQCSLPGGSYTVYLSTGYNKSDGDPHKDFTVTAGETTEVTGVAPPAVERAVVGSATGPATAAQGALYKVSGVLESATYGSADRAFSALTISLSNNSSLQGATVNGVNTVLFSVSGYTNSIDISSNEAVDWTFPLNYTLYLRQNADVGGSQSVTVQATYAGETATIGAVTTRSVPGVTLYAPARLGSQGNGTSISGRTVLEPEAFPFSGSAAASTDVRLYDNDTLIAIAKADAKGQYSGTARLVGGGRSHTLSAEQTVTAEGGAMVSATRELVYDPIGPVLTELALYTNGNKIPLSIAGASSAYTATGSMRYQYEAVIRNSGKLDEMTVSNPAAAEEGDARYLTGKVFFRVSTVGGEYLLPATGSGDKWTSAEYRFGANYPTGVEVIYQAAESAPAMTEVTLTGENGGTTAKTVRVDNAFELLEIDSSLESSLLEMMGLGDADTATLGGADKEYYGSDPATPIYQSEDITAEPDGAGGENAVYAALLCAAGNGKSLGDILQSIADALNPKDSEQIDGFSDAVVITGAQAIAKNDNSNGYTEVRTWADEPSFDKNRPELYTDALTRAGYESSAADYNGKTILRFSGTFYYDQYGMPCDGPTVVNYGGNFGKERIPNPRMYSNGVMVGSALHVDYFYFDLGSGDSNKMWLRNQVAVIPKGAASPIHMAANQIPSKNLAPIRLQTTAAAAKTLDAGANAVYAAVVRAGSSDKQGFSYAVDPAKVSWQTYGGGLISLASFGTGAALCKASDAGRLAKGADRWSYSLSPGDSIVTIKFAVAGYYMPSSSKTSFGTFSELRKKLMANYTYYSKISDNPTHARRCGWGMDATKELLESLSDIEYTVEMEGVQQAFDDNVTSSLTYASFLAAFFGGAPGLVTAGVFDLTSFIIKAADDTHNENVKAAVERFTKKLDAYMASDSDRKTAMKEVEQQHTEDNKRLPVPVYDIDKRVFDDPFDPNSQVPSSGGSSSGSSGGSSGDSSGGGQTGAVNDQAGSSQTAQTTPVHDPSGVVYEAVLSNPVAGATVTLYRYESESNPMAVWDDSAYLKQQNPLASDETGYYRWDVPEGEWYVVATAAGYAEGSSQNDTAATLAHGGYNYLPVLPPQLNVNIPLVSYAAPTVESVEAKSDGVYITFSKYMDESTLTSANFTLNGQPVTPEKLDSEQAPSNIKYEGDAPRYTKTVKLAAGLSGTASVTISDSMRSYAGVKMAGAYSANLTVTEKTQLSAPTITPASTDSAERNALVTITAESGATIYYTTNGDTPTTASTKYIGPFVINREMTVKAIAVKTGYEDSPVAEATYRFAVTVNGGGNNNNNNGSNNNTGRGGTSSSGGNDSGAVSTVAIPASGGGGLAVSATVSGGTATVSPISDNAITSAVGSDGGNASVVLDLTSLGSAVDTVSVPAASVQKIADALERNGGSDSLTVKTANGSVKLGENALSAVVDAGGAGNVAFTLKNSGADSLNAAHAAAVAGKEISGAHTLGVASNGKDVGALGSGFAEVNVPFVPEAGTDALDYRVYRVSESGEAVLVPSAIHDGGLTVRSDRLEDIVIVREPLDETFSDLNTSAYYGDAALWAAANRVANGMDGLFNGDGACTRAQVVTFLWRAAGSPQPKGSVSGFADVAVDTWYSQAVAWAVENGVTNGVGDDLFGTDTVCTRAQVVTFLYRMNGGRAANVTEFADVPRNTWYTDAVSWADENNITNGVGDNTFGTNMNCTRAQIVTFLYRDFMR